MWFFWGTLLIENSRYLPNYLKYSFVLPILIRDVKIYQIPHNAMGAAFVFPDYDDVLYDQDDLLEFA